MIISCATTQPSSGICGSLQLPAPGYATAMESKGSSRHLVSLAPNRALRTVLDCALCLPYHWQLQEKRVTQVFPALLTDLAFQC